MGDVSSDLIASVILIILGWFINRLWILLRRLLPISKALGRIHGDQERVIIVIPSFYANVRNLLKNIQSPTQVIMWASQLPLYSEGDASCLLFIYSTLLYAGKNYRNIEIKSDIEITGDDLRENLICIGAGSNEISRNFFESLEHSINFEYTATTFGTSIRNKRNNQQYTASNQDDFSIILKTINPNNNQKDIIIFAGLGPVGTKGAGYFFYRDWRTISNRSQYRTRNNYIILLQVNQNDYTRLSEIDFTKEMVV